MVGRSTRNIARIKHIYYLFVDQITFFNKTRMHLDCSLLLNKYAVRINTCDDDLFVFKIHQKISYFKKFSINGSLLWLFIIILICWFTNRRHKLCPFIKTDCIFLPLICVSFSNVYLCIKIPFRRSGKFLTIIF